MRVGINGRFLAYPNTGIGKYTYYLFSEYAKKFPDDTLIFVAPTKISENQKKLFPEKNVEFFYLPEKKLPTAGLKKFFFEQFQLPEFFTAKRVDLLHSPYPSNPVILSHKSFKTIVTVHDTIPWVLKEYATSFLSRIYQNFAKKNIKKADLILTVSNTSKQEIEMSCGIDPQKIHVIHNGNSPLFSAHERHDYHNALRILKKYNLDLTRKYFFAIGGFDKRKNVIKLVDAYYQNVAATCDFDLVIAGGKSLNTPLYDSYDYAMRMSKKLLRENSKGKIHMINFVEEKDLPHLYSSAVAHVNLSLKEGFNLPILESLSVKTPVIAADILVNHEIAGDDIFYVNAHDENEIGMALNKVATNLEFLKTLKEKVERHKNPFTWEKSALELNSIYKNLI